MSELRVKSEPLVYERRGPNSRHSFFRDFALRECGSGDGAAEGRLARHEAEMRVEVPAMEKRLAKNPEIEYRVNPNRTDGQGGYFAVPLWAESAWAGAVRPGRVLAGLIPGFDLPEKVTSIHLPKMTTGTEASTPTDGAPAANQDVIDSVIESPAMTVTGNSDWSLQALEQSPAGAHLDHAVLTDLNAAADADLETKLFTGTGTNREITGILNLPTGAGGVSSVTFTSASPHQYELVTEMGKVGGQLGDARKLPPECWLMRTARFCAISGSTDEEKRPLATPGHVAAEPVSYQFNDSRPAVASPFFSFPTYLSDAIPATLGVGGNQDLICAIRPSDFMLFESDNKTAVYKEVLSGTLQARFTLRRYAAALWRQPQGIAILGGTGLVIPSEE